MLKIVLKRLIRIGRLTVIEADGGVIVCGVAAIGQPDVVVKLTGRLTSLKLALWPDLYLGEAYRRASVRTMGYYFRVPRGRGSPKPPDEG